MPCIVRGLHAHPHSRAISKQLPKPDRNGRRNRLTLTQNVVKMLPGNAEKLRNLDLGLAGCRNHVLSQQSAGVSGAAIWIAPCDACHDDLSSVILFKIPATGVAVFEFKRDAHGPFTWTE